MGLLDFGVGDVLNLAKVAVGVYSALKSNQIAENQADIAKKEARRTAALTAARVKRETRVRKAQLLASQGNAGAVLSSATQGAIGLDSTLAFGLAEQQSQLDGQIDQFNLGASNVRTQGYVDIAASLGTFAVTDTAAKAGDSFTDLINPPTSTGKPTSVANPLGLTSGQGL